MKRTMTLVLAALMIVMAGCGDSHKQVIDDTLGIMEDMTAVLKGVKTEADAKAAAPKIEALKVKAEGLEKRAKALGDPSEADMKEMLTSSMDKMMKVGMEAQAETARVLSDPALAKHLEKPLGDLNKAVKSN